jgi:hypothetical protein
VKEHLFALLDQLDRSGSERASHTRVLMSVLLRTLPDFEDRAQTLEFLNEYSDPPAPKPRLQVIAGGLS